MPPRRSERSNKGKLPSISDFSTENSSGESETSDDDLDSTIVSKMADDSVKLLIENLSKQFLEMKTELSDKSDAMKKSLEEKNKELDAKLEATNKQLTEVRQSMNDSSKSQTNATDLSTSGAVSQSTTISSNVSVPTNTTTTTTTSSTSATITSEPTAGFSGNLLNHQATSNLASTGMQFPYTNFTQFPIRKHLVALTPFDGNPCDWLVFSADYKRTTIE